MYCKMNKIYCDMANENGYCKLSTCINPKFNANIHPTDMIHSVGERSKAVHFKESKWHTGTPTEEGWYIVAYKPYNRDDLGIGYEVLQFNGGCWYDSNDNWTDPFMVAWQKIEPYKESE